MNITLRLFTLLAICALASCKSKDTYAPTTPPVYTIVLDTPRVSGNKVVIRWLAVAPAQVKTIMLTRADSVRRITSVVVLDPKATEYTDTFVMARNVQYYVTAQVVAGSINQTVVSNKQKFTRPDVEFLNIVPNRVLFDHNTRLLYLASLEGELALYDLGNKRTIKHISGVSITDFNLGSYNSRKELYVSRHDGWLFIYDAATLDLLEQINIGAGLGNAVCNNGKIFISSAYPGGAMAAYDRATKTKISDTAYNYSMTLRMLPGTNTSLLGIYSSGQVHRFNFDSDGIFSSKQSSAILSHETASWPFEVYPDGEKFITSGSGTVFSKNLEYLSGLPHGSLYFNSFDFDNSNRQIYAGCTDAQVNVYSMDNYQFVKTIKTRGYPIRVFYDNGTVISVSSDYPNPSYSSLTFIERL